MWINIVLISIGLIIAGCEHFGYNIVIKSDDPLMDKVEDYIESETGIKIDITYPGNKDEKKE